MKARISVFILSSMIAVCLHAQEATARRALKNNVDKQAQPALFMGMALTVEVGSPLLYTLGNDALSTEGGLRLNFKNKYFPIAELGYGKYESTHDDTEIHFKTSAPYMRAGLDINMLKDKAQENRMLMGFRVGFSSYRFDVDGPALTDPIWGTSQEWGFNDVKSNRLWLEIVIGLESEILRHFHMGFSIRYKKQLSEKVPEQATPYWIPGFGNTDNGFRATYNLYFDLTKKRKVMNYE